MNRITVSAKKWGGEILPPPAPAALLQQIQSIPIASLISDFGFHESTINKIGSQIFFAFNLIEKFIVKSKFTRVTEAFWSWICVRYIKNKICTGIYFFSILHKQNHHEIISYWIKRHVQSKKHFGPVVNLKSLNTWGAQCSRVNWIGFFCHKFDLQKCFLQKIVPIRTTFINDAFWKLIFLKHRPICAGPHKYASQFKSDQQNIWQDQTFDLKSALIECAPLSFTSVVILSLNAVISVQCATMKYYRTENDRHRQLSRIFLFFSWQIIGRRADEPFFSADGIGFKIEFSIF